MQKLVRTAAMGILTGLAIQSQAQSYLSQDRLSFSKRQNAQLESLADIKLRDDDEPDKVFSLALSMHTRGSRIDDDNVKASTSATSVSVDFTWNMTTWFKSDLSAGFQLASGQSQTVYGSETNPYTGPTIDEASFTFKPGDVLAVSAGLVGTQFNPIYSVFGGDALAGFREVLNYENGIFRTSLKGYQAVPTQLNSSNRIIDDNQDASLILTNFNIGLVGKRNELMLSYSKYDFYKMASAAAEDSQYLGNTMISDEGDNNNFFRYKFQGQEVALGAATTFRLDDKLSFKGTYMKNDQAPERRNTGWMTQTAYLLNMGRYSFRPAVTRFRLEPDVLPSFYTIGSYGYTNRDGYSGELRGGIKKYNFEGYVRYVDAKEIENKLFQSDRVSYTVGLEVKYEIL